MTNIIQFLMEVKAELTKVVWPTKSDTARYTIVVIAFSLVLALVLGAADYGLSKFVGTLVNK